MERKVKYNYEFKLHCVEEVLKNHKGLEPTASKYDISNTSLKRWISFYMKFGSEGLLPKSRNTKYSLNFKLKVLHSIDNKALSLGKACLAFNIPAKSTILSWQQEYKRDGLKGLKLKPKGRTPAMNFKRKPRKTNQPLTREEELLKELEYLRAENEILKKFNALVQAEQAKQNKRLKP
ncbi:transposase [Flavobacterium sp. TR2]|uniref:helix-turn-helix domain-containing protein n=1 Tax=Flavobacterium sp. TR2 TaxID=2977321 RepID=UPI0021B0E7A0|nr:transposase [Flavobacterium sp. TR2]UWY28895.1 transposase [Flavobacterium sp. TR2]UWY30010.1 transposase [Flavobacterium sp. TR2]